MSDQYSRREALKTLGLALGACAATSRIGRW
jgi:hypothetical protein